MISDLANYLQVDEEKRHLINDLLFPEHYLKANFSLSDSDFSEYDLKQVKRPTKYCPKCFKKFEQFKNSGNSEISNIKRRVRRTQYEIN